MACMVADMADTMGGGELMNHDSWLVKSSSLALLASITGHV